MDPSVPGAATCSCHRNDANFYCRYCRKSIPGFDHHCTWLNTCIGATNYFYFYSLSVSGKLFIIL